MSGQQEFGLLDALRDGAPQLSGLSCRVFDQFGHVMGSGRVEALCRCGQVVFNDHHNTIPRWVKAPSDPTFITFKVIVGQHACIDVECIQFFRDWSQVNPNFKHVGHLVLVKKLKVQTFKAYKAGLHAFFDGLYLTQPDCVSQQLFPAVAVESRFAGGAQAACGGRHLQQT